MFNSKLSKNFYLTPLYQGEPEAGLVYAGISGSHGISVLDLLCRLNDHFIYSIEPFRSTKKDSLQLDFHANIFICSVKQ